MQRLLWLLIPLLFCVYGCRKQGQPAYSFFVAGHVYGRPGVNEPGVYPPFRAEFDAIRQTYRMRFGILTGDIVIHSTDQDWDEVDSVMNILNIPIYFVKGNHDNDPERRFDKRYGNPFRSFTQNGDLFLLLDSNPAGWNISGKQLDWVTAMLSAFQKEGRNIFLFVHHLIWYDEGRFASGFTPNSLDGRHPEPDFWTTLAPLLRQTHKPVYLFAGDIGAIPTSNGFFCYREDNLHLLGSGMGNGLTDNYLKVHVNEKGKVGLSIIPIGNATGLPEDLPDCLNPS